MSSRRLSPSSGQSVRLVKETPVTPERGYRYRLWPVFEAFVRVSAFHKGCSMLKWADARPPQPPGM